MKLLFDIGNTRMKVSTAEHGNITPTESWLELLHVAENVLVSNVAGPEALPEEVALHRNCKILTWESSEAGLWLKKIPAGLGADRVAADIGARSIRPNQTLLIIDAGTCLTFDVIAKDGSIVGGAISPGISLRLKAMHEHTAALPLLEPAGEHPILGYDTPTSMRSGAVNGVKWEIEGYIRSILASYPDLHVFFTGGDGTEFPKDLQPIITCDTLLVQKGLLAAFGRN
ncbi:MAG: type III pantothenate kinase [Bacteroidaceae bacterium]|nr:type III pantothenate kinase [Bacteroidaceae bacterium]